MFDRRKLDEIARGSESGAFTPAGCVFEAALWIMILAWLCQPELTLITRINFQNHVSII